MLNTLLHNGQAVTEIWGQAHTLVHTHTNTHSHLDKGVHKVTQRNTQSSTGTCVCGGAGATVASHTPCVNTHKVATHIQPYTQHATAL